MSYSSTVVEYSSASMSSCGLRVRFIQKDSYVLLSKRYTVYSHIFKIMPRGQRQGGQLQLKRQAFRNHIRRQELMEYFANIRSNLQRTEIHLQEQEVERVMRIVDGLPHSHQELVQSIVENLDATCQVLLQRMEEIADRMVRLEIMQWASYVRVLNKLLVSIPSKKAEGMVKHTLLGVLECADVLTSQYHHNLYMSGQLVELTLDYLYRCGKFLMEINRLQLSAVIAAVDRVWHSRLDYQQLRTLLKLSVNLLSAQFDHDQLENISPQREGDLELLKKQFVNCVFFRDLQTLRKLIRLTVDSMSEIELTDVLVLGLRLLVNITQMQDKPSFYYPLLDFNVLHLVEFCIMQGISAESTCYAVRLLNNILVNDHALTSSIMRELSLSILLNAYQRQRGTLNRDDFISLFINMLLFLGENEQQVRRMMDQATVHVLIFDFLEDFDEVDEHLVKCALNVCIIMHEHNSMEMRRIVRERGEVLRKLPNRHEVDVDILEQILRFEKEDFDFV